MGVGGVAPAARAGLSKAPSHEPSSFESVNKHDNPAQALLNWTTRATSGLGLSASLYTIMQALSLTLFEKTPISQLLTEATEADGSEEDMRNPNQLNLFDFSLGH